MNKLLTEVVRSDIGLTVSTITETPDYFNVKTKFSTPKVIFGLLFGVPGILLLGSLIATPTLVEFILAIIFCPILFYFSILFGLSVSEKNFDKSKRIFTNSLQVLNYNFAESHQVPHDSKISIKSENRGSAKAAPGSTIRYSIHVENCPGAGFAISRDKDTAYSFANKLANFLELPIEDQVTH